MWFLTEAGWVENLMSADHWAFLRVCGWLCVWKDKRKENETGLLMCQFFMIAMYKENMIVCVWMSVFLGLDNTAFVFLKNPCHSLPVSPLRLVLMWWYLIWHPSTLPHNPLALQETDILQPLLSVCTLLFPLGSRSGGCPSITMPEWMSGDGSFHPLRHRGLSETIGDICRTHTACFEGVYSFSQ